MINPKDLMQKMSVEELCEAADRYFQSKPDVVSIMSKPFHSTRVTPMTLQRMGLLLSGLHLGKGMTVLDFGAGTCWFSRFLTQLQCWAIACDPSMTALKIGKRLYEEYPIIGKPLADPVFLPYDGHTIALSDGSVDRILCFDAFHHVPNQREVLSEFYRVLKDGGIAGFREPGRDHAQTPGAQAEMKNFKVLENDIIIEEIYAFAKEIGFTGISFKSALDVDFSLEDYDTLAVKKRRVRRELREKIIHAIREEMDFHTIFFLSKGNRIPDSRTLEGLSHAMRVDRQRVLVRRGEGLTLSLDITNTGSNKWLHESFKDIGTVRIGTHLYNESHRLLRFDFTRHPLSESILPGETFTRTITIEFGERGRFILAIDMVSEGICWFEWAGSDVLLVHVEVT